MVQRSLGCRLAFPPTPAFLGGPIGFWLPPAIFPVPEVFARLEWWLHVITIKRKAPVPVDFRKKSPRRPLIVAGRCRRPLLRRS